ncbi:unnamed protein product, partial [marine sediment metagenome]
NIYYCILMQVNNKLFCITCGLVVDRSSHTIAYYWCSLDCFLKKPRKDFILSLCQTCREPMVHEIKWDRMFCSPKCRRATKETKRKQSKVQTKRYEDPEARQKTSEATRESMTEEVRKKMNEANIKRFEDPKERQKLRETQLKRYEDPEERRKTGEAISKSMTKEVRKKISKATSGENNPMYKDGRSFFYGPNWVKQQDTCRERDDNICQLCSKTKVEHIHNNSLGKPTPHNMIIHHIIFFEEFGEENYKKANKLTNIICLCMSCHSSIHHNLQFYTEHTQKLQELANKSTKRFLEEGQLLKTIKTAK